MSAMVLSGEADIQGEGHLSYAAAENDTLD